MDDNLEKRVKEELDSLQDVGIPIGQLLQIYIVPIFVISIFLSIIVLFVIPKIGEVFNNVSEINNLNNLQLKKIDELNKLQELAQDVPELSRDLEEINELAPTGETEVVLFQNKLLNLAQSFNLSVNDQQLNEVRTTNSGIKNDFLYLREIPNYFELSGTYENMQQFIQALSTIDDFIIIEEMFLTENRFAESTFQNWNLTLNLIKYQFSEVGDDDQLEQVYLQVPLEFEGSEAVKDFIQIRQFEE